jgi:hypothetical protein
MSARGGQQTLASRSAHHHDPLVAEVEEVLQLLPAQRAVSGPRLHLRAMNRGVPLVEDLHLFATALVADGRIAVHSRDDRSVLLTSASSVSVTTEPQPPQRYSMTAAVPAGATLRTAAVRPSSPRRADTRR